MLGEAKESNLGLKDLSLREIAVLAPLIVWAFWIGVSAQSYFQILERPVAQVVERFRPGYYAKPGLPSPLEAPKSAALARR
jgi:NADH:ubiquinone oxidoreductase subunit 4 (subunit M)